MPSNLKSETGHKIGVGKNSMLCVKKSIIIWQGQANIGKAKSLFILYAIPIKIKAITILWEKSYKSYTQYGRASTEGFPNLSLTLLNNRLYRKYKPKENKSGNAPKSKENHLYFLYPKNPFP